MNRAPLSHALSRHLRLAIASVVVTGLIGCADGGASRKPGDQTASSPPPDRSWMDAKYTQAGLPSHERSWSGIDMAEASKIFVKLAREDPGLLPRYQSPRSGKTFARIMADDNLNFFRNRTLPLESRFPNMFTFLESSNAIAKLYLAGYHRRAVGSAELVEFTGLQLRVSVATLGLMAEFMPTLDKNDPTYPVRLAGLKKAKSGLSNIVAGSLYTLTERETYGLPELRRLLKYMIATFPDIIPHLPVSSRTETVVRLESYCKDSEMSILNPDLTNLLAVTKGAAKKADDFE